MKCCRCVFFFYGYGEHRDLPLLTHSFPTRRSSELLALEIEGRLVGRDVDRAGRRILAIERALRPAQHLDLRDVEEIEGRGSDARIIDVVDIDADPLLDPIVGQPERRADSAAIRSEERSAGKEWVCTGNTRGCP